MLSQSQQFSQSWKRLIFRNSPLEALVQGKVRLKALEHAYCCPSSILVQVLEKRTITMDLKMDNG